MGRLSNSTDKKVLYNLSNFLARASKVRRVAIDNYAVVNQQNAG